MSDKTNDILVITDKFEETLHKTYDSLYDDFIAKFKNFCNGEDIIVHDDEQLDFYSGQKIQYQNKSRVITNCKAYLDITDFVWKLTPGGTDINILKEIIKNGGIVIVKNKLIDADFLDKLSFE